MQKSIDRDGTKLAFRDSGGVGDPVVLIHGWCCDSSFFEPQFKHFSALGRRSRSSWSRRKRRPDRQLYDGDFADDVA